MDTHNTWLHQEGRRQIESYTSSADVYLPGRHEIIQLLIDLFWYHFGERKELSVLDLGCGDGLITELIHARFPEHAFYLLDGSLAMLEKAKERLGQNGFVFTHQTFESYIDSGVDDAKYDFCFSVNAIHHLSFLDKARLFTKLHRELKHGGLFLISDPIQPASAQSESWQFRMWVDWIKRTLEACGRADEASAYDDLPSNYKRKAENKPSGLFEQMQLLQRIGFRDVDCFWKHGIFAVFGGTK